MLESTRMVQLSLWRASEAGGTSSSPLALRSPNGLLRILTPLPSLNSPESNCLSAELCQSSTLKDFLSLRPLPLLPTLSLPHHPLLHHPLPMRQLSALELELEPHLKIFLSSKTLETFLTISTMNKETFGAIVHSKPPILYHKTMRF